LAIPDGLPAGGFVVPNPAFSQGEPSTGAALWITADPVPDPGPVFARLLAAHRETGLWPLLLTEQESSSGRPWHAGEICPVPAGRVDRLDAAALLAARWEREAGLKPERFDFGDGTFPGVSRSAWPGPAGPAGPGSDPDQAAAGVVTAPGALAQLTPDAEAVFIGLVPAADGAAALAAIGWQSSAGDVAELAAVVRSWQRRFGARLCAIGSDTLGLAVAWPPATPEQALRVAAEHAAFCREAAYGADLNEYATELLGAPIWGFWWE
jgi:hypothetical protein